MIMSRIPKIFSARRSPPREELPEITFDDEASVYSQPTPIDDNQSHFIPVDEPRPVPPPDRRIEFSGSDAYEPTEPRSRLYETFSVSDKEPPRQLTSQDGHSEGYEQNHPEEYQFELASVQPARIERSHPVQLAPSSERTGSSRGQRVTFIGDLNDRDGSPVSRSATDDSMRTSSSARSYEREYQYSPSRPRRYERFIEQKLPYLIFVDWGNGLEIGNELDGFMPYEEYITTAHLRRRRGETYFIIPGNCPVIFHDADGRELYRVDAQKYNTRFMRRRRYIIQDEYGNERYRIGNFSDYEREGSYASSSASGSSENSWPSRAKAPRVIYMDSRGSSSSLSGYSYSGSTQSSDISSRIQSDSVRSASSASSTPDILVVDENGRQVFDSRDIDDSVRRSPKARYKPNYDYKSRPNYVFVDEKGRPVKKEQYYPEEFGGSSSGRSDESSRSHHRIPQILYI